MKTKKTDPEATKTAPAPAEGDSGRLSTALELLRTILETGTTNQKPAATAFTARQPWRCRSNCTATSACGAAPGNS
jgi:hypothetical protein